ncbi:MAG: hypothetical protein JWQ40_320 [Segetibacter sp.]|nr:hypothetical protein [Segetibacter sp.]
MSFQPSPFLKYITSKENKIWLQLTALIGIVSFIVLRLLYSMPSYYSDSFTWIGAAKTLQPITFRPVGYSKLIVFFRYLSTSDIALIAGQYVCNLMANLLLFFTVSWFFPLKKVFKVLLFVLLIANPFYLFYSNYVSSDAFFNCFTVAWFTSLIWIMNKPSWPVMISQVVLLAGLFALRYNALIFPAITTIAFLLSKQSLLNKAVGIAGSFAVIISIVVYTTYKTKVFTGTKTFSAFSGWQLANDALHILRHDKVDPTTIEDKEVRDLLKFTVHFFDTTKQTFPDTAATAFYMWYPESPLKEYMKVYPKRMKPYFGTWNALGPLYSKFGSTLILQKPFSYLQHFVWLNAKAYFFPKMEIYETYMEGRDTIPPFVKKYYKYKSNKAPSHHPAVYAGVFTPAQYLFILMNLLFPALSIYYFLSGKYREQPVLFNHTLLCFGAFYMVNFFFIVLLAPTVFRYHVFILTLSFPVVLYLIQQIFRARRTIS